MRSMTIKYHVIWIHNVPLQDNARDRGACVRLGAANLSEQEIVIVRGAVSPDHMHMLLSVPRQLAPAKLVQFIKGWSSGKLQR